MSSPGDVTQLLEAASSGNSEAVDQLLPLVYDELRRIASDYLSRERSDHTLQPTALVHEAYLRLVNQRTAGWNDRAQFFGVAAKAMRRILVDRARMHKAAKRGGASARKLELDEAVASFEERALDLVALDEALKKLAEFDERKARVVELRFFGGLSAPEAAKVLNCPLRTIERDWTTAKAWLRAEISEN
ncbi:MAG TPA: sigma-70 family RNA polymerase sigma factor [Phycisphaerae bacterium]|nr:sigma-70 family RNA polymerase sigma factor [Phycisphaerae bacterium]HRW52703.1 sigma-70 family RNA polymerase sigma factor [Phycisphaerae bacterium]